MSQRKTNTQTDRSENINSVSVLVLQNMVCTYSLLRMRVMLLVLTFSNLLESETNGLTDRQKWKKCVITFVIKLLRSVCLNFLAILENLKFKIEKIYSSQTIWKTKWRSFIFSLFGLKVLGQLNYCATNFSSTERYLIMIYSQI